MSLKRSSDSRTADLELTKVNTVHPGLCLIGSEDRLNVPRELLIVLWYTLTVLITRYTEFSVLFLSIFAVSHLGKASLAGAHVATSVHGLCVVSITSGLCTSVEVLCSQSVGSAHPERTSLYACRSFLMVSCLIPVQFALYLCSEGIFLRWGAGAEMAALAGVYLRIMAFAIPPTVAWDCLRRYLWAQGHTRQLFVVKLLRFSTTDLTHIVTSISVLGFLISGSLMGILIYGPFVHRSFLLW